MANLYNLGNLPLKGGEEGTLVISVFEAKELNKEEIKNFPLTSNRLFHGPKCGGNVKMSEITESTNVLYCEKCGLRISYPSKIKKFGELQGWV